VQALNALIRHIACYSDHCVDFSSLNNSQSIIRNMRKILKGDNQYDSKMWHWLGLARLCSDCLRKNERDPGTLCHRHSNDTQDLP